MYPRVTVVIHRIGSRYCVKSPVAGSGLAFCWASDPNDTAEAALAGALAFVAGRLSACGGHPDSLENKEESHV